MDMEAEYKDIGIVYDHRIAPREGYTDMHIETNTSNDPGYEIIAPRPFCTGESDITGDLSTQQMVFDRLPLPARERTALIDWLKLNNPTTIPTTTFRERGSKRARKSSDVG